MNKTIELICKLLPNDVKVTVPVIDKDTLYTVTGVTNIQSDIPTVVATKDSNATFNIPVNLIDKIMVVDLSK